MAASYIEKKTDMMHQLLWNNILKELVGKGLVLGAAAIPYAGPFLAKFFGNSVVQGILLWLISTFIEVPLFTILVRFGVFTSVDWKEDSIYSAYEKEAAKLLPLQDKAVWSKEDEKAFDDGAANLIRFNFAQ